MSAKEEKKSGGMATKEGDDADGKELMRAGLQEDDDIFSIPIRSCTVFTLAFWFKGNVVTMFEVMVEVFGRSLGSEHT